MTATREGLKYVKKRDVIVRHRRTEEECGRRGGWECVGRGGMGAGECSAKLSPGHIVL